MTPSTPDSRPTPAKPPKPGKRAREGNQGTTLTPAQPAHTPNTSSSDKPLPDRTPPYDPPPPPGARRRSRLRGKPAQPVDTSSKEDSFWGSSAIDMCYVASGAVTSGCSCASSHATLPGRYAESRPIVIMLVLLARVVFTCLVGAIRLACWLLKLMIVWTVALVALISSSSAARRRSATSRPAR